MDNILAGRKFCTPFYYKEDVINFDLIIGNLNSYFLDCKI